MRSDLFSFVFYARPPSQMRVDRVRPSKALLSFPDSRLFFFYGRHVSSHDGCARSSFLLKADDFGIPRAAFFNSPPALPNPWSVPPSAVSRGPPLRSRAVATIALYCDLRGAFPRLRTSPPRAWRVCILSRFHPDTIPPLRGWLSFSAEDFFPPSRSPGSLVPPPHSLDAGSTHSRSWVGVLFSCRFFPPTMMSLPLLFVFCRSPPIVFRRRFLMFRSRCRNPQ